MLMETPIRSAPALRRMSVGPGNAAQPSHSLGAIEMMGSQMTFGPNEEIFGESEQSDYVYKVVSGAVRTYKILNDGRRQIEAFYLPGDVFGLEIGTEHQFSAEAINRTVVRMVRRSALLGLAERDCETARELWAFAARELHQTQERMLLLVKSAPQRIASFRAMPLDMVAAHKWFNIAAALGVRDAARLRNEVAAELSDNEIAAAQRAARHWLTRH